MTTATLLVMPKHKAGQNLFDFDHAMAHRQLLSVMGPLSQWSAIPYHVTPQRLQSRPATNWYFNHQKAHNDFNSFLPAYATVAVGKRGIPTHQILVEGDLRKQGSHQWWIHNNHQEHFIANQAILPYPGALATVPWWSLLPYRVRVFW